MKWIVFTLLGVVLLFVLAALVFPKKKRREEAAPVFEDLADLPPTAARRGDTVSVLAMGADYDDLDFVVDRINRYEADGERWSELSGVYRNERVFLELYEDDALEVTLSRAADALRFGDLPLGEPDLIRFDDAQSGSFEWAGVRWEFDESCEVMFFEDGRGGGEGCYTWTFRESPADAGGDTPPRVLYVEKWEGEPFEAGMGQPVRPDDVRVFRA